jgi:hypothetical protein
MSRTRFGTEYSGGPTKFIPLVDIFVDDNESNPTQRSYEKAFGHWIAENLDPNKLGIIHVSLRKNGRYYAIDGQHRVNGLKERFGNNGTLVECKVYEGLDRVGEAQMFHALNGLRRPVHTLDNFLVSVTGEDPVNSAIVRILAEFGLCVTRNTAADGAVRAVGALRSVYLGFANQSRRATSDAKPQADLLRATIGFIKAAWGTNTCAYDGSIIEGVGRLLAARWKVIDRELFAKKLAPYPGGPKALLGMARGRRELLGGTVALAVADLMIDVYNKGRRTDKVEPLR